MFVLPAETATTRPAFDTVAIPPALEDHPEPVAEPFNWLVAPMHKEEFPVTVGNALTVTWMVVEHTLILV